MNIPLSMSQMIISFESNVNTVTSGNSNNGGLVGDISNQVKDGIASGIIDGISWLAQSLCEILIPIGKWGCKFVIISCIIIYCCSEDKKYVSSGIRALIIFTLLCFLGSVVL